MAYGHHDADVAIVFGHGFTGSQRNPKVIGLVGGLVENGFAVYTADFRGHGASAGRSTLGEQEVHDLEALVDLARSRHARIVTVGASMGGFVALRHVGLGGHVDAVVAISSPVFSSVPKLPRARVLSHLARSRRGRWLLERHGTRVDPDVHIAIAPIELAAAIAPTPVGIIHGTRDRYVPLSDAEALHERLHEPRRLVILPDFGHGEAGFGPAFPGVLVGLVHDLLAASSASPSA
jgi:pimeloyl-ACP methyl ester carboxylesterase